MAFAGKVALISGGTKGIGRATAVTLAKGGASVVINYGRDAKAAEEAVQAIGADRALAVQADAGSIDGIEKLVKAAVDKFGKIDILIPNAALLLMRDVASTTEADFDRTYNLNVKGPYFLIQKAAPHMGNGSHIVLMSTTQDFASTVTGDYLLYCSAKGAIDQMTRILAKDLGRKGISVNSIAPGPTGTDLFLEGKSQEIINRLASLNPYNRLGQPDDIADAIAFLCSDASRWVNGQCIRVNGGSA